MYIHFCDPDYFWRTWFGEESRMADTGDETTTIPRTGELFTLATRPPRRQHTFGPRLRVLPHASPSTHEQHEWKCQCCPMFKITVLPRGQDPRREYRYADGCQFEDSQEPECVPMLADRGVRP